MTCTKDDISYCIKGPAATGTRCFILDVSFIIQKNIYLVFTVACGKPTYRRFVLKATVCSSGYLPHVTCVPRVYQHYRWFRISVARGNRCCPALCTCHIAKTRGIAVTNKDRIRNEAYRTYLKQFFGENNKTGKVRINVTLRVISLNHCYRGKAVSVIHSEGFSSLICLKRKAHARVLYFNVWLVWIYHIFSKFSH